MLGRDVFVTETARLLLAELEDTLRPGIQRERATLDPRAVRPRTEASSSRNAGMSTPSRRSVSAGTPSSGSTSAARMCSASSTGLGAAGRCCWAVDDGLLGLFGVSIELHGVFSGIWVGRRAFGISRGSGVWLVDDLDERAGGAVGLVVELPSAGRPGPDVEIAVALATEAGHALALEPEATAVLGPCGIRSRTLPLNVVTGTSPPRSASPRVIGSSRSRSAPCRREDRVRLDADRRRRDRRHPDPAGEPDPSARLDAARDRHLEPLAVDLDPAGRAVVRLFQADLGDRPRRSRGPPGRRRGPSRAARPAAGAGRRAG